MLSILSFAACKAVAVTLDLIRICLTLICSPLLSINCTIWYPNWDSTTSEISPSFKRKAALSNSGTKSPLFTKPSSPPLIAEPGSSEYKVANILKSSPL